MCIGSTSDSFRAVCENCGSSGAFMVHNRLQRMTSRFFFYQTPLTWRPSHRHGMGHECMEPQRCVTYPVVENTIIHSKCKICGTYSNACGRRAQEDGITCQTAPSGARDKRPWYAYWIMHTSSVCVQIFIHMATRTLRIGRVDKSECDCQTHKKSGNWWPRSPTSSAVHLQVN